MAAAVLAIPVLGLWLGLRHWFPDILSTHGVGIQYMLDYTLIVTGAFFIVGHLVLAALIIRALRKPDRLTPLPTRRAERLVGIIPAVLMAVVAEGGVIALGLPVWDQYYREPPEDAIKIEVTGRQFFWAIRYPGADTAFGRTDTSLVTTDNPIGLDVTDPASSDDIVILNEIHLPDNRPATILLRSYDVIHSFFVPELRLKQDLMPGMTVPVWFQPTGTGQYELACNQICGLGHYRMRGILHLEPQAAFEHWLAAQTPLASEL
jgi:cytochrome c oxidase subunit 2